MAVFPLIEEIVENLGLHKMIIGSGAGTRARHAYSVGLDLGLPTGVLSVLGTFVSMQNARIESLPPWAVSTSARSYTPILSIVAERSLPTQTLTV